MGSSCSTTATVIMPPKATVLNFQEVKEGLLTDSILLIDVRNESERVEPGRIPGSVHVPLFTVMAAFAVMSPSEFEAEYDFKRPEKLVDPKGKKTVLTCSTGSRSAKAAEILISLGYEGIHVYSGSFNDWQAKGGPILKGQSQNQLVTFEELQQGLQEGLLTVVDVRNPKERVSPGHIPGSFNVPLSTIWDSFGKLDQGAFRQKYDFDRPPKSTTKLVLLCLKGKRAVDAADKLSLLGYENVKIYKGSFHEWMVKGGNVIRDETV